MVSSTNITFLSIWQETLKDVYLLNITNQLHTNHSIELKFTTDNDILFRGHVVASSSLQAAVLHARTHVEISKIKQHHQQHQHQHRLLISFIVFSQHGFPDVIVIM